MIRILQAESPEHIAAAHALFLKYAESLGFSLCFQDFDSELAKLPGDYVPPNGRLLLAYRDGQPVGCAALHGLGDSIGEMKRLYVRPEARGTGLGRRLSEMVVDAAREAGYTRLRLDTIENLMPAAVALYRAQGFREIEPYRHNPIAGALYLELDLRSPTL